MEVESLCHLFSQVKITFQLCSTLRLPVTYSIVFFFSYGSLGPCPDLRTILCLAEADNKTNEATKPEPKYQQYYDQNLTDPVFIHEVVRARPISINTAASKAVEPVYRGRPEAANVQSEGSIPELRSIPPSIYVENGTLFISGTRHPPTAISGSRQACVVDSSCF